VALYRAWPERQLRADGNLVPIPQKVWDHFSNLRNIEKLGDSTGIEIIVLDRELGERRQYIREMAQRIRQYTADPKVVFLDPDTGIEPQAPKLKHVTIRDIQEIWEALEPDDWLAVYQHAYRRGNWCEESKDKFRRACGVEQVTAFLGEKIAADVAVFAAQKTRT